MNTAAAPCRFGVNPGNYTVTAWIGDRASAGSTERNLSLVPYLV